MKDIPSAVLRDRRCALLAGLPPLTRLLRGSLVESYKRCGRPGCHCADGPGHGPKHYLSVSTTGERPRMTYVRQEERPEAAEFLGNFRAVRAALNEICAINAELLRRHEDLG
jgi:uncharacterized protein DUF6788